MNIETLANKYSLIAALLSEVVVIEMTAMRAAVAADSKLASLQNEKCVNLRTARDTVEAVAAGYAGCDNDARQTFGGGPESLLDAIMKDVLGKGIGVMQIDPSEMFKGPEPKAPPAENKAQSAAYAAKQEAACKAAAGASPHKQRISVLRVK